MRDKNVLGHTGGRIGKKNLKEANKMEFRSSRLLVGLSPTKLIFPDKIELESDRLRVTKKKWFGLTGAEEEIKYERIASTRLKKGVLSATIAIETSGGSKEDLHLKSLRKKDGRELNKTIKEITST